MMTVQSDLDPRELRRVMSRFASGVTIVTTVTQDGEPAGCTISAFCSVSLDPPLVLVCIGKDRYMYQLLTKAPGYAVSVLGSDQAALALRFARPGRDRFVGAGLRRGRHDIPLLTGAIAHIECSRYSVLDGGDHGIVVGQVHDATATDGDPLLHASGTFLHLSTPKQDPVTADINEWLLSAPW